MQQVRSHNAIGTSFHGTTFKASVAQLRKVLGEPEGEYNDGRDKTNFDWTMQTDDGHVFTVYDWKYYRPLSEDETVEWHISGASSFATITARTEILRAIANLKWNTKY